MWIVTYFIIQTLIIECPKGIPAKDEFGRTPVISWENSIACTRTDSTFCYKFFYNKDSALAFIGRGRADSADYIGAGGLYEDKGGQLSGFTLYNPYIIDTVKSKNENNSTNRRRRRY